MIILYKMTCFHPCHILPWYVTVSIPAFFYPPFLLLAGKDRRHETFPHFFSSLTRLVKTSQREEMCHFSPTANQQNITASPALERSPFPQRPKQQHLLWDSWNECCEGTSRACTVLHTLTVVPFSQLYFSRWMYTFFPFFFFTFIVIICYALMGVWVKFYCNLAYFHKEILISSRCLLPTLNLLLTLPGNRLVSDTKGWTWHLPCDVNGCWQVDGQARMAELPPL